MVNVVESAPVAAARSERSSATRFPAKMPLTPTPGVSDTSVMTAAIIESLSSERRSASLNGWRLARASASMIAFCSLVASAKFIGSGRPSVSVPVLSNIAQSTSDKRSSAEPSFTRTPARINAPVTTICAAGTARPSAQGQVIMRTATAISRLWCQPAPNTIHPAKLSRATV